MTWDEWEQLKSEAAQGTSPHMQLDRALPGDRDSTGQDSPHGDLKATQKDLAAIGDAAYRLYTGFQSAGGRAKAASAKAAGGLAKEGFEVGGALSHVANRWSEQVRDLLDACAHISNHLDYTWKVHSGDEQYIGDTISSIAQLDEGFNERKGS